MSSLRKTNTDPPGTNPNIPQIPQPVADVGSLLNAVQALKQAVDSLAGFRGDQLGRAVTFNDLLRLQLSSKVAITSPGGASDLTTAPIAKATMEITAAYTAAIATAVSGISFTDTTLTSSGVVSAGGFVFIANSSGGPITVTVADNLAPFVLIKDVLGNAAAHNITVSASGIDGGTTVVMAVNYQWTWLVWDALIGKYAVVG